MSKWVNNDWQTNGIRTVNACPQPGYAEAELPDDHEALQNITGFVPPEVQADRDLGSDVAQTIFTELMTSPADRARVRAALVSRYANSAPRIRQVTERKGNS